MKENNSWNVFFVALGSIGTVLVAIMAIWGEWVRSKFVGPKLTLVPHNLRGNITTLTETDLRTGDVLRQYRGIYYHLKVENTRRWITAKNCRVMLRQLHRRGPDGVFHPVPLMVPLQYVWSPAEWSPSLQTVADYEILDFGRLSESSETFTPTLYVTSANFQGFVGPNDAVRYSLSIVADNFNSSKLQVFEVAWNGQWSDNPDEMARNLIIREINQ